MLVAAISLAGCGGGGADTGGAFATPPPARTFSLQGFQASDIQAGKPTDVSFAIEQPSGKPLTDYATGSGPHTGVHLLFARSDLSTIIHLHPPVGADGTIDEKVTFKEPGRYRVVVDAYPNTNGSPTAQKNFQLFKWIDVQPKATDKPVPGYQAEQTVDGYTVAIQGQPNLKALEASLLDITVTDKHGKPAQFTPWYGALAHAIFFRAGSLDYFHTHVCAPNATGCTSVLGGAQVTGTSDQPGKLQVGVLVPVAGTWRLFIQVKANGKVLTAPFTLTVK